MRDIFRKKFTEPVLRRWAKVLGKEKQFHAIEHCPAARPGYRPKTESTYFDG